MVIDMHHLIGPAEVAALLGVSRQRVTQLAAQPDFPKPEAELSMGKVWKRDAVVKWARSKGRDV